MSDHQLVYCTRRISRIKRRSHRQIKFRSFKHYTVDLFKQKLSKLTFPNYQNHNDNNEACNDFIQKTMGVIDKVMPMKEWRITQNYQEWFDGKFLCLSYLNAKTLKGFDKGMITGMIAINLKNLGLWLNWPWLTLGKVMCYFSKRTINWLKSYLSSRSFLVNLGNNFPQHASVFCGVPQCSILGSLSFLIYLSDLLQAVKFDLFSLCWWFVPCL